MQNKSLVQDYIKRARARVLALDVLYKEESWADVVRESQEVVELLLKALLRKAGVEPPRVHDVSQILMDNKERIVGLITKEVLSKLCKISKELRRDRELAFYGSEDLTPSEFYEQDDADQARGWAQWTLAEVTKAAKG